MRTFLGALPVFILLFSTGCGGALKNETGNDPSLPSQYLQVGDKKYMVVDTKESVIEWKGSNTFGSHSGYVSISEGELIVENGQLAGGTVTVDMTTIVDEQRKGNSGLIQHLKDPDFFDVTRFTSASITLTKVASKNAADKELTGNLTIKGMKNPVLFPARIDMTKGMLKATGRLVIDRTRWGVRYGSGKFFDNLKDQTISDDIEFKIMIVAKAKG